MITITMGTGAERAVRRFADQAAYDAWLATDEGRAWATTWDAGAAWMAEAERATGRARRWARPW